MNEQLARDVALVRAIETVDSRREILSDDDRMYASRSARELAQWQAADHKAAPTTELFLQQRAEQILKRLVERTPPLGIVLRRRAGLGMVAWLLPLVALALGAGLDRIGNPHRVDLLSAPLLAILGWNLLAYVALLVMLVLPPFKPPRWLGNASMTLPRRLPHALIAALSEFAVQWRILSAPLDRARLARTLHLSAALFALGAVLSLYARGFLTQYVAGWESTFLDAGQVHAILSFIFAPALALLPLQGFTLAEIDALQFAKSPGVAGGARWVHLYGATLILLVVLPRLVLAALAHWRARRLREHFPIDLQQPYYRKLAGESGASVAAVLRVYPYSFTLDEARDAGLHRIAAMLLGEQTRVMLRPSSAYGEEPDDIGASEADAVTAVLFNMAATPEKENHGAFLAHVLRHSPGGITVLADESALAERGADPVRLGERSALWQQFCAHHGSRAIIVNLLHPDQRPVEQQP